MGDQVSPTRLYLGNLPREVTKEDIQNHFKDGSGTITEIKLMNGFGFIEYDDAMDARDVVPAYHGSDLNGSRLTVQFARGSRQQREPFAAPIHSHPRPRRTAYRMQITGLPGETSWQDLKDFARRSSLDVVYSEVGRDKDGKGFVEFETAADLKVAVEKLDNQEFKGNTVRCTSDEQSEIPRNDYRHRSRSPPYRRGGYPSNGGYYSSRRDPPPSRGYSPHRDDGGYRRRSPLRDHYYDEPRDHGRYRSPPRGGGRGPPADDYQSARGGGYGDPYGPPPSRRYPEDPYPTNGYSRGRVGRSPPRSYEYDPPRRYW